MGTRRTKFPSCDLCLRRRLSFSRRLSSPSSWTSWRPSSGALVLHSKPLARLLTFYLPSRFVGATGSTTISFILPALFCKSPYPVPRPQTNRLSTVLALFQHSESSRKDRVLRLVATALLAWGVVVMVVSLSLNICTSLALSSCGT